MRKQLVTLTIFSLLVSTISFPIYAEEITASENEDDSILISENLY